MKIITFFIGHVEKFAFLLGMVAIMLLATSCGSRRPVKQQGKSFEVVNFSGDYTILNDSIATQQRKTRVGTLIGSKLVFKLNKTNNKYFICK
jgi:hypothetical protein